MNAPTSASASAPAPAPVAVAAPVATVARRWTTLCLLPVLLLTGCSQFLSEYGASGGASGRESLNGFGAFRTALQDSPTDVLPEIQTHDVARLSDQESQSDAIVWIPTAWSPSNLQAAQDWLGNWLAQGQRTLVFIVPDGGSTEAYYREASARAPAGQRLNYRRQLAELINERLLTDAERSEVSLGDWFTAEPLPYRIELPDRQLVDFSVERSPLQSASSKQGSDEIRFEPLVEESSHSPAGSNSLTTLARITRKRWQSSQVLVVASGSLLTNFAMTDSAAQKMADEIRGEIRRARGKETDTPIHVAFLSSSYASIPISDATPGFPKARGWELMTEMPLSLINLHVAFLGIVLCLMLLPVFGRPHRVRYNQPTHFGNHLSAMASLMRRSGGTQYAKQKISAYLRQVRGETSGPWVLPQEDAADSDQTSETQP